MINFEEFSQVEMRVGEVKKAEKVEGADKLLRLEVDLGEPAARQVVSGIAKTFMEPEKLIGKQLVFVTNLEPREIFGLESQAMIMAASREKRNGEKEVVLVKPMKKVKPGTRLS